MTRTIYDEYYGVGVDTAISADYVLRLPYAESGARYWLLRPSVASLSVRLPIAGAARKWASITVANHGSHSLTIRDLIGTAVYALAVGERVSLTLVDDSTPWGTWAKDVSTSTVGATLVHDRVSLRVIFGTWAGTGINLRSYCEGVFGYDGLKPASIYCQLHSSIVIGSGCQIVGIGGKGGNGGDVPPGLLSQSGSAGGDALVCRINTALVNHGTISGGGGGGGGGTAVSGTGGGGGGGGGGGAGYQPSVSGLGGTPGGQPGSGGAIGTQSPGGSGGGSGQAGGSGGGPGANGSAAGGAGGAAGNAIKRLTAVTVNKIVVGTINGPEVTF